MCFGCVFEIYSNLDKVRLSILSDVPGGSHGASARTKVPDEKRDVKQCEPMTLARPFVRRRWSIKLIKLIRNWIIYTPEIKHRYQKLPHFKGIHLFQSIILGIQPLVFRGWSFINSRGPTSHQMMSVVGPLYSANKIQWPMINPSGSDQSISLTRNDWYELYIHIFICFQSSYSNVLVFVALNSSTYHITTWLPPI